MSLQNHLYPIPLVTGSFWTLLSSAKTPRQTDKALNHCTSSRVLSPWASSLGVDAMSPVFHRVVSCSLGQRGLRSILSFRYECCFSLFFIQRHLDRESPNSSPAAVWMPCNTAVSSIVSIRMRSTATFGPFFDKGSRKILMQRNIHTMRWIALECSYFRWERRLHITEHQAYER